MLKNLKRASAIALSLAMSIQFGLADSYYANVNSEQPVVEQQEQTQEQEPATVEQNNTVQEQSNTQAEQPVAETQQQPETKSIELSYVSEEGETLQAATSKDYAVDYALNQDASVMLSFDGYTLKDVVINNSQTISASQAQASLNVSQDMTSVKFVYTKNNTEETKTNENTENKKEETKQEKKTEEDADKEDENKIATYIATNEADLSVKVGQKLTLTPEKVSKTEWYNWSVDSTYLSMESSSKDSLTVKGKKVISSTTVAYTNAKNEQEVWTVEVTGDTSKSYKLYHYALIPGKKASSSGDANDSWYGMGVTEITDVSDPSTLTPGAQSGFTYTYESTDKELYPDVTYNGKTYKYAKPGSGNENTEGYYTLTPSQIMVSAGANAGNNNYNSTVASNYLTYHQDYTMTINEITVKTVTFNVLYPEENEYFVLNDYSQRVDRGTSESEIKKPSNTDVPKTTTDSNGNKYTFDGWYRDKNCTQKVDFKTTTKKITENTNYYGKYVTKQYTVKYDSNGGSAIDSVSLKYNDKVDVSKVPTRAEYIFEGWYYNNKQVTDSKYSDLAKDESKEEITLIAEWKKDLTAIAENVEKTYDGKSYGIEVKPSEKDATVKYYNETTQQYDLDESPKQTDVGTTIVKYQVSKDGYTTVIGQAKVTISQRKVTLTSATDSKPYDGTPLTNKTVTPSGDGFVDGEGATYEVTGSQTIPGGSKNTFTYKLNSNTKESNYIITKVEGDLTVTDRVEKYQITVQSNGGNAKYDGNKHEVDGLVTDTFTVDGNKYKVTGLTAHGEGTDANSYDNVISGTAVVKDAKGNDVTKQFDVNTVVGKLVIAKRNVTLTSATVSKPYDGTPLTNSTVTPSEDGFIEGEGATYVVTGSQTIPGSSKNTFTYKLNSNTKESNYNITKVEGDLTVTDRAEKYEVTVSAASGGDKYNGNEQSVGTELTGTTFEWNGATFTIEGLTASGAKGADAGTYENTISGKAVVKDENGNTVTKQFKVKTIDGNLVISKRDVILTSAKDSKTYDGTPLTNSTVTSSGDGFVDGEGATYNVTGSQTKPGSSDNDFDYQLNENTKAKNYNITKVVGKLTVLNRSDKYEIEVTAKSDELPYDGQKHEVDGLVTDTFTVNGNEYKVTGLTAHAEGKDAGDYSSKIKGTAKVLDANGNDVTSEFKVNLNDGSLKIKTRKVTLTSATDSKKYDGSALTNSEVIVSDDGFVEGEGATYDVTGSQTIPGSNSNKFTYKLNDNTQEKNYTIETKTGTLTVEDVDRAYETTVKASSSLNNVYDGTKKSAGKDLTGTSFTWNGHKYTIEGLTSENVTKKDAGTYENKVEGTAVVKDSKGNDVTSQFTIIKQSGSLAITKRVVKLKSATDSRPYDGTELRRPVVEFLDGTSFVEGEVSDVKAIGRITNVGSVKNIIAYTINTTKFKESNYEIHKTQGTLSITSKSIVPDGPDTPDDKKTGITVSEPQDHVYDGKEHKEVLTVKDTKTGKDLVSGTDYDVAYTDDLVNAGTVTITITGKDNYTGSFTKTYEITKRVVKLKSDTASKPYDGTALTRPDVEYVEGSFVKGEVSDVKATGTVTNVSEGKVTNTITYTTHETFKAGNYDISKDEGKLSITSKSIVPDGPDTPDDKKTGITVSEPQDHVYDGTEHKEVLTVTDTKTGKKLVEGTDYDVSYTKDLVNAGTVTITITGKDNYSGTFNKTYQIAPAPITIKTDYASRPYNGKALTAGGEVTGIVSGETYTFKTTGSQTKVGSSDNTYELTWNGTAKESNYTITSETIGTLTVTENAEQIVVTTTGGTFTYDGQAHGATVNVSQLPEGYTLETATSNASATDVTDGVKATCDTLVIRNAEGEDVTSKLNIKKVDGTIIINPATLTITTPNASKTYDGSALTAEGTISGFVNNETATFKTTGSQTAVGNSKNTYELTWDGTAKESNYTISDTVGTLIVAAQSINPEDEKNYGGVTVNSPENKIYNGQDQTWTPEVKDSKGNKLGKNDYKVSYSKTDRTNVTGKITVTIEGQGNYSGKVTRTYEITPKEYTVTTDSDSKTYDGTALTAGGQVKGLVEGETVDFKTTGSQTEQGSSKNTYELKWTGTATESNYKHGKDSIGTLTVSKQSITPGVDPENPDPDYDGIEINSPSDVVYDGAEHKWVPSVTDKNDKALSKADYTVSYDSNDFTDVGTIRVTITGIGNYTGTVVRTYKITPRKYTITTLGGTKVYDGRALTNFGMVEGIVSGETYSFRTTGSQTEVGSSDNTYEFEWNGTAKKSNYVLDKESIGKLVVTAKSIIPDTPDTPDTNKTGITVSDPSDSKYDGTEHREVLTVKDTKTGKELVSGTDYDVTYSNDLVNAGTVTITVTGKGNYAGSFTKAYKITKRSVTLTSASATKTYDGTALTNDSIEVSGDGFVKGEGATYVVTGTQTNVGNSANSFEYTFNKNTLASNYSVTKVVGTLRITRATTPVTPATPTTPAVPSTPSTPNTSGTTTLPSVVQRIVNVLNPTPAPSENVETNKTPKANRETETVEEDYTPKATRKYYWALINLICAILTVLFGLLLLISKRHKNKDDDDEEEQDDETKQATKDTDTDEDEEEEEPEKKRGLFTRVLAVLIAIVSVVLFLLTEDMSLPWVWVDKWTVWMVVIGLVQIVVFFVGRKWKKVDDDDDEEDEEQAQQA